MHKNKKGLDKKSYKYLFSELLYLLALVNLRVVPRLNLVLMGGTVTLCMYVAMYVRT